VVELIAHRGYARRYPENTLAAVEAALAAGARHVEIDVQLSRDRVPFLMHDRTLERMCGVGGSLAERTADELSRLRAAEAERFGSAFAGEPLATLAGFVAALASRDARAFVEIKRAALEVFGPDAVLDAVLPALEPLRGRCTLISFDVEVLLRARERSDVPRGPVLIDWRQLERVETARIEPSVIFCDVEKLPAGPLVAPCDLAVYEIDDPRVARELQGRGVRFVETFAIGEMLEALA
jgi:glycerophosphoryl diester phosphodiesterase